MKPSRSEWAVMHLAQWVASTGEVGWGYLIDSAGYAVSPSPPRTSDQAAPQGLPDELVRVAVRHARALGYVRFVVHAERRRHPAGTVAGRAVHLAQQATALRALARGVSLSLEDVRALELAQWGAEAASGGTDTSRVVIHVDGGFDARDGVMSVGYTLNAHPYATTVEPDGTPGGAIAEREAIRVALQHALALNFECFEVRSDHVFHVRRYAQNLVYRGRRKSASVERLDALVDQLAGRVRFQHAVTRDSDAPHRLAVHARALARLARGLPLSRAQASALRRVHFALRAGRPVLF